MRRWSKTGYNGGWNEGLLPPDQSGFRKGKSCLDNVSQLVLDADTAFSDGKDVLAAFLDVKGAFNNIDPRAMANKMADLGCPTNLVNLALFLTEHRLVYSELNTDSLREIYKGVPQGIVLSPLLYPLTVKDITDGVSRHVKISQFADNFAFFVTSFSTE